MPERQSPDAIGPAFDKWILSDALMSLSARTIVRPSSRTYYLGQTVADIAAHEQIPPGTVKSGSITRCGRCESRCRKGGCSMTNDDNLAEWDAAYVLGALGVDERLEYERYLAATPARAAELTELAGLPGILNSLTRDEAAALIEDVDVQPAAERPLDLMPSLTRAAASSGDPVAPSSRLPLPPRPRS